VTLVDTNVLLDIWYADPEWETWSKAAVSRAGSRGAVVVNPIVLAELSPRFEEESHLTDLLAALRVELVALPVSAAWHAGKALQLYRKRGGIRPSPPPDFFIGAHAMAEGWTILTRDPRRYRTYFPKVKLIAPRS
jgi:predicted nucleic acid-binding protein